MESASYDDETPHFLEALFASSEGRDAGKSTTPGGREKHAYFDKKFLLERTPIPSEQLVK